MKQNSGGATSKQWREQRRQRALALIAQGWRQGQIAEALGVSQAAVSQWLAADGGQDGSQERRGRPAKLAGEHLRLVPDLLSHGAEVWGFRGEVWTCARVAAVIKEEFGVLYSSSQVSRLLKALEWTPQQPIERASQRDDAAIAAWRAERWPLLKKKARANGWRVVFIDESGFYLLPGRRRTYAPRGHTPILHVPCSCDHLSVMAAVTMAGELFSRVRARSLNSFDSVAFIQRLQARWPKSKLLVIWDGSPIHRFKAVRAFQQTPAAANFIFEQLPGYAPDLNPLDAGVWHHLKDVALANVCCHDLDQLQEELARAIKVLRAKPRLIQACFGAAKLSMKL